MHAFLLWNAFMSFHTCFLPESIPIHCFKMAEESDHLVVAGQIFDSFVEHPATCVVHVIIYSWESHILGHHVRFSFADPMAPYSVQHLSSLAKLTCTKLSCYILTTMVSNTLLTHRSQWLYRIEWESSWLPLKINSFVSPVGSGNWIAHIWKSRVLFSPH